MHKASLSIYKALKQFYVIFLIKLVLNFNQFITLMTLSTHTGEKKYSIFPQYGLKKKTVLAHVRCIPWFSSVIPKKPTPSPNCLETPYLTIVFSVITHKYQHQHIKKS